MAFGPEMFAQGARFRLKFTHAAVLAVWYLGGLMFFLSLALRHGDRPAQPEAPTGDRPGRTSYVGAFRLHWAETDGQFKRVFDVAGGGIRTDNARRGIFSTSLCKTIVVDDLQITVRSETARGPSDKPEDTETDGSGLPVYRGELAELINSLRQTVLDRSESLRGRFDEAGLAPRLRTDMSNATGLVIRGLTYNSYDSNGLALGIQCRRTAFSSSLPEIVLEGSVIVRGPDGNQLAGHCVRWDFGQNRFTVPGRHAWYGSGRWVRRCNARYDRKLDILAEENVADKEGAKRWARTVFR